MKLPIWTHVLMFVTLLVAAAVARRVFWPQLDFPFAAVFGGLGAVWIGSVSSRRHLKRLEANRDAAQR